MGWTYITIGTVSIQTKTFQYLQQQIDTTMNFLAEWCRHLSVTCSHSELTDSSECVWQHFFFFRLYHGNSFTLQPVNVFQLFFFCVATHSVFIFNESKPVNMATILDAQLLLPEHVLYIEHQLTSHIIDHCNICVPLCGFFHCLFLYY